jgi:hypothetical protein
MARAAVLLLAASSAAPKSAAAALDEDTCNKLRTERQSLVVLGADKHFAKGADWAKANLAAADLNLVKRYLDVYEQIKFRCDKIVAIAEPDELGGGGDDDDAAAGNAPPMPQRRSVKSDKAAVKQPAKPGGSAPAVKPGHSAANAATFSIGPATTVPAR